MQNEDLTHRCASVKEDTPCPVQFEGHHSFTIFCDQCCTSVSVCKRGDVYAEVDEDLVDQLRKHYKLDGHMPAEDVLLFKHQKSTEVISSCDGCNEPLHTPCRPLRMCKYCQGV